MPREVLQLFVLTPNLATRSFSKGSNQVDLTVFPSTQTRVILAFDAV